MPLDIQYMRNWNQGYMQWAQANGLRRDSDPIQIHLYSEVMQRFRRAAQGKGCGRRPPPHLRERVATYCDPLPFYREPLESGFIDTERYPLNAVSQRPMAMYHAWDSQNAWLRQIHTENFLFVNPKTALAAGIADGGWMWVESPWGKVRCRCRHSEGVEPGTVWTWNAIGKAPGAWGLAEGANESRRGFLLNHLLSEELLMSDGAHPGGVRVSNADPVTGQAGWYDVRVRIVPVQPGEPEQTWPSPQPVQPLPGQGGPGWVAGLGQGRRGVGGGGAA
jgi:anaerobic selenocysteine-containing dehydrogenase